MDGLSERERKYHPTKGHVAPNRKPINKIDLYLAPRTRWSSWAAEPSCHPTTASRRQRHSQGRRRGFQCCRDTLLLPTLNNHIKVDVVQSLNIVIIASKFMSAFNQPSRVPARAGVHHLPAQRRLPRRPPPLGRTPRLLRPQGKTRTYDVRKYNDRIYEGGHTMAERFFYKSFCPRLPRKPSTYHNCMRSGGPKYWFSANSNDILILLHSNLASLAS